MPATRFPFARVLRPSRSTPFEGYAPEGNVDADSPVIVARLPAQSDNGYEALIWEKRKGTRAFTALVRSVDSEQRQAVELEAAWHPATVRLLHALCLGFVTGSVSLREPTQTCRWEVDRKLSDISMTLSLLAHQARFDDKSFIRLKITRRLGAMLVDRPVTLVFDDLALARRTAKAFHARRLEAFAIKVA